MSDLRGDGQRAYTASERIVMEAYARCRQALARRDVAAIVDELRALRPHPAERELLTAMIDAGMGMSQRDCALAGHNPGCDRAPNSEEDSSPEAPRGQALVEMALVMPIVILVIVGGLVLGLAMHDRSQRTYEAQQAATAAAEAGAEDSACDAAIATVQAVSGRVSTDCVGTDGLTMSYDPPTVTIRLEGGTWPVPFVDTVTVSGEATAMLRPREAVLSSTPSPEATP